MQRYSYGERCPRSVNRTAGPRTPRFFLSFYSSCTVHTRRSVGILLIGGGSCAECFLIERSGTGRGLTLFGGAGGRIPLELEMNWYLRIHGSVASLIRLWGLVYGIHGVFFLRDVEC